MELTYTKINTSNVNVPLKVLPGHFATNHAHTNYHLDLTTLKSRASEAKEIALSLAGKLYGTMIDTILCVEGTEVIGAFLAEELTRSGFINTNAHKTIYIVTPEYDANSLVIFRDNLKPTIKKKHILILAGSVSTGKTIRRFMNAIHYYGGVLTGVSAVFTAVDSLYGLPVLSVFSTKDLPDYMYSDHHDCPFCKENKKLDGLINAFGISLL